MNIRYERIRDVYDAAQSYIWLCVKLSINFYCDIEDLGPTSCEYQHNWVVFRLLLKVITVLLQAKWQLWFAVDYHRKEFLLNLLSGCITF